MIEFLKAWGTNIQKNALLVIAVFVGYMLVEACVKFDKYAEVFNEFGVWMAAWGLFIVLFGFFIIPALLVFSLLITLFQYLRR